MNLFSLSSYYSVLIKFFVALPLRPVDCMDPRPVVPQEVARLREGASTALVLTSVRFLAGVRATMLGERRQVAEPLAAVHAAVRSGPGVRAEMYS